MNIWQRFRDRIFDAPFGKTTEADHAHALALGKAIEPQLLANMMKSRERNRQQIGGSTAYKRGQDAAARRGEYAGSNHMLECPYAEGSENAVAFLHGYYDEAQYIDGEKNGDE